MRIEINITGLEGLVSVLERFLSVTPVTAPAPMAAIANPAQLSVVQSAPVQPTQVQQPMPPQPVAAPVQTMQPAPVATPVYPDPVNTPQAQATMPTTMQAPVMGSSVPVAAQTYTMEQLAVAATQLVDAGRRQDLVNLLASFGVQALTELPKDHFGNFATQLRAMGAKI